VRAAAARMVAGARVDLNKFVDAPKRRFDERLNIYESGRAEEEGTCVGYVRSHTIPSVRKLLCVVMC
jgi:hypothetical protein